MKTTFKNSDLDLIAALSVKVWKLNQCTEIKESSNLGNCLKNRSCDILKLQYSKKYPTVL